MKKLRLSFIFVLILSIFVLGKDSVFAGTLKMKNLDFEVRVNKDASMQVTEIWDINVKETNTLFKTFDTDMSKYSGIRDVKVVNLDTNLELTQINTLMYHVTKDHYYGLYNENRDFEIAWGVGLDNSSDRVKYKITYTVDDAISLHDDCAQLYWQFVTNELGSNIEKIKGTIYLPDDNLKKDDVKVWGHTDTLNGYIESNDGGIIQFDLKQIPNGDVVEIRSAFPREIIDSSSRVYEGTTLEDIINQETKLADIANYRRELKKKSAIIGISIVSAIFGIIGLIQFIIPFNVLRKAKKKLTPILDVDYFRDIPREDATPAEADALVMGINGFSTGNFANVFSATLMDLNLKKYITFRMMNENGSESVAIGLGPKEPIEGDLKKDEKEIYDFVKDSITSNSKEEITMKELQKYIQGNPKKIVNVQGNIVKITNEFLKNEKYINRSEVIKSIKLIVDIISVIFILFYLISNVFLSGQQISQSIGIPIYTYTCCAIIIIILCIVAVKRLNVYTQKAVDEIDKWKGLKKYMEDFSQMDEKDLPSIVLWEKYLVYATAFGMTDKVIKQLKLVYPEIQNLDYISSNEIYAVYVSSYMNFSNSFSDSINTTISRYNSASSSGSGHGGGFSSGGGGGGGGGHMGGR